MLNVEIRFDESKESTTDIKNYYDKGYRYAILDTNELLRDHTIIDQIFETEEELEQLRPDAIAHDLVIKLSDYI